MSLVQRTVCGGALILLIVVIRALALHRLPKRTFLVLWEVAALRLLLSFTVPAPLPVPVSLAGTAAGEVYEMTAGAAGGVPAVPETVFAAPEAWDWAAALTAVWMAGAALMAAYFLLLYLRAMRRFRTSLPDGDPAVRRWLAAQKLRRPLEVRQSDQTASPLTYGVLRPVILLPRDMDRGDAAALTEILTHELVHVRRLDGAAKAVFAAALCVHWFNPLVWVLYVLANRDLELSCDEAVMGLLGGEGRTSYALTLIRMEEARSLSFSLCNHFGRLAIEERIEAIMNYRKKSLFAAGLAAVLVIGATTAFAAPAPAEGDGGVQTVIDRTVLLMSGGGGEKRYSVDGGETWMSEERYHAQYGGWGDGWQVEWWTAGEYEKWLEQEKKDLREIIGSQGWTPSTGWFTWDQKRVDETVAMYEGILEEIKNGALYSKTILDKDGQEVSDVSLGSDAPLGTVIASAYEDSGSAAPEPVDVEALLKELEPFGVSGGEKEGLTYQGQPVRTLVDGVPMGEGYAVRYVYRGDAGTADLHTLRSVRHNPDGSYDPVGELTAVVSKGERGFDQGLIDSCAAPEAVQAAAVDMGTETHEGTPLPGMFDKYAAYGLAYRETKTAEGVERNLSYNGKPVNHFADLKPDGGVFTFASSEQTPEGLTVRAVYGGDGELTGLRAE